MRRLASVLILLTLAPAARATDEESKAALVRCFRAVSHDIVNSRYPDLDAAWAGLCRESDSVCTEGSVRRELVAARNEMTVRMSPWTGTIRTQLDLAEAMLRYADDWERSLRTAPPMDR